jgi:hypothetical protein
MIGLPKENNDIDINTDDKKKTNKYKNANIKYECINFKECKNYLTTFVSYREGHKSEDINRQLHDYSTIETSCKSCKKSDFSTVIIFD